MLAFEHKPQLTLSKFQYIKKKKKMATNIYLCFHLPIKAAYRDYNNMLLHMDR